MKNLFYIEQCLSTNDSILEYLSMDFIDCISVYTFHQKKGRGQYGNVWHGSVSENLAISFAIPCTCIPFTYDLFNYHTAIIIREFFANLSDEVVKIKWPNDFILKNKKISGMIIEKIKIKNIEYYIIGVGLNVLQEKFEEFPNAGSIFSLTQKKLDLHEIANSFFSFFSMKIFKNKSIENILKEYNNHLFNRGKIRVFSINNNLQNGIISFADEKGFLWIDLEKDGMRKFLNKEVEMLY